VHRTAPHAFVDFPGHKDLGPHITQIDDHCLASQSPCTAARVSGATYNLLRLSRLRPNDSDRCKYESLLRARGRVELVLLTLTAREFFNELGYRR
jgi:hypothetical protein